LEAGLTSPSVANPHALKFSPQELVKMPPVLSGVLDKAECNGQQPPAKTIQLNLDLKEYRHEK
jgi:hypothetical protein